MAMIAVQVKEMIMRRILVFLLPLAGCLDLNAGYNDGGADGGAVDAAVKEKIAGDAEAVSDLAKDAPTAADALAIDDGDMLLPAPADMTLLPDLTNCLQTLSGIGAGDFTVSFTVAVGNPGLSAALLTQRPTCDNSQPFWYIAMKSDGTPYAETNPPYVGINAVSSVSDGKAHLVALQRAGGALSLAIDHQIEAVAASSSVFGALPALEVGQSAACNVSPIAGLKINDVCLTAP
jgi:hypothetical protein